MHTIYILNCLFYNEIPEIRSFINGFHLLAPKNLFRTIGFWKLLSQ